MIFRREQICKNVHEGASATFASAEDIGKCLDSFNLITDVMNEATTSQRHTIHITNDFLSVFNATHCEVKLHYI